MTNLSCNYPLASWCLIPSWRRFQLAEEDREAASTASVEDKALGAALDAALASKVGL